MNLIVLLQSGDDGPVKVVGTTQKGLRRLVDTLQRGNPDLLHIREALDGDERLERRIHVELEHLHRSRDWYEPQILMFLEEYKRWDRFDRDEEQQRINAAALDDLQAPTMEITP